MLLPITATAPSAWASYLINEDDSSLLHDLTPTEAEEELRQVHAFVDFIGAWPVSCEDAGFLHTHDASRFGTLAADCQTYTALIEG